MLLLAILIHMNISQIYLYIIFREIGENWEISIPYSSKKIFTTYYGKNIIKMPLTICDERQVQNHSLIIKHITSKKCKNVKYAIRSALTLIMLATSQIKT